jgi:lambda family phage portal protein
MGYKVLDHRGDVVASTEIDRARSRRKALSAYRGASSGRTTSDWYGSNGSPDSTLIPERWSLIYRIRERLRNDPVMRGCLKKVVDSVVGPKGFSTTAQLDYERLKISQEQAREIQRDIDFEWEQWQKECDYAGNPSRNFTFTSLLSMQLSTELTCGETLTIPRYFRRPWARFSFCIQLVAPDRICNPISHGGPYRSTTTINGEDVRDGVKIGRRGDIQGIYVARQHPGSYSFAKDAWQTDYIPSWNYKTQRANFWHNFQLYAPEATRGEPAFAACLMGFRALGDYVQDELTRAHMITMFGLAISRSEGFDPDTEGVPDSDKVGDGRERDHAQVELYPGMVNYLEEGETASVISANVPGAQWDEFTDKLATWTAAPLGLSREEVLNSYNGMSFSASKASRVTSQRSARKAQDDVVENYIRPCRRRVIEEAWLRGRLKLPGFENPEIRSLYYADVTYASPWQELEPVKEETASKMRLANRTSSVIRECAMKGINFDNIVQEWAHEKKAFEGLKVQLPPHLMDPVDPNAVAPGTGKPSSKKDLEELLSLLQVAYGQDEESE